MRRKTVVSTSTANGSETMFRGIFNRQKEVVFHPNTTIRLRTWGTLTRATWGYFGMIFLQPKVIQERYD